MNTKQMLCTALAVLHTESLLAKPNKDHELIKRLLREARLPEFVEEDDERAALIVIKEIITSIIEGEVEFDVATILRQIKLETTQNKPFYESVKEYLSIDDLPEDSEERLKALDKTVNALYYQVRQGLSTIALRQSLGKAFGALNGTDTRSDLTETLDSLKSNISSYTERSHNKIPSLISTLNTGKPSHFIQVFDSIAEKAAGNGLKTGWQDMNKMLGVAGGLAEEMVLMPALPHNCKSLFSLLTSISVPLFNSPEEVMKGIKGTKQPIIIDLSLENENDINLSYAYQAIHGHFEGTAPDMNMATGTAEEKAEKTNTMSNYFCSMMERNGWRYEFQKHTNDNFRVHYLQDIISQANRDGYHVVGIRADYLGTINKAGHGNGIAGSDIKEIYRIARNIQVVKNRGFILAPHQISPEGKRLRAIDEASFVKNLPGRGLYDTCSSLDNEADAELYFGKRSVEGKWYLEVQRGKHRTIIDTPEKDRYTVIPFADVGILPWDVDREIKSTANSINKFAGGFGGDDLF